MLKLFNILFDSIQKNYLIQVFFDLLIEILMNVNYVLSILNIFIYYKNNYTQYLKMKEEQSDNPRRLAAERRR